MANPVGPRWPQHSALNQHYKDVITNNICVTDGDQLPFSQKKHQHGQQRASLEEHCIHVTVAEALWDRLKKLLNEWDEWEWSTAVRQRRIDWPCHPVLCQFMDLLLIEKLGFTSDLRNAALNCINIYIAGIFMHCRANVEFLRNCNMESRLAMTAFFLRGCSLRFRRPLTNLFHQE